MDYQKVIKNYMKQNGITYADLASALGVTKQRAWAMLNNKSSMRLDTVNKIAKVLGMELALF